ncbi:MAG: hypothetical protein JWO65_1895 [Sphingomonas bacterium]|nr:hypothetical protein [Sphingomonas bacterium]
MRRIAGRICCVVGSLLAIGAAPPLAPPISPISPDFTLSSRPPLIWLLQKDRLLASLTAQPGVTDPLTPYIAVRGQVNYNGRPVTAELLTDDATAIYILQTRDAKGMDGQMIDTPSKALALLADRNTAFLWPALTAWVGQDMGALRDRMLTRARTIYEDGGRGRARQVSGAMAGNRVAATLNYASALVDAGRRDDAVALVRISFDLLRTEPKHDDFDLSMLGMRLERMLQYYQPDALPGIDAALDAAIPASSPYYVNLEINRADIRASAGQYADALALLDRAERGFHSSKRYNISGTGSEFSAIRACALNGLGRIEEARTLLDGLPDARAKTPAFNESASTIRWRTLICMKDVAGVARMMRSELADDTLVSISTLQLQPAGMSHNPNARIVDTALRADPVLAAAFAARSRVLPPPMNAAINW